MVALALLALSLLTSSAQSQNENAQHRAEPSHSPGVIDFEDASISQLPPGWSGGPAGTLHSDNQIAHSGKWSVRLERGTGSPGEFSALTAHIPIYFAGNQIVLRGYLRIENVEQFAGLWVREDGDEGKMISLENMQGQNLRGTREWAEYSVTLPLDPKARTLYFGALLAGTGKVWVDDLQLLVDGKPAVTASERARTVLDRDHQFDDGSGIELAQLSATQVENLVTLGRVWGFLKYHHPAVTSGDRQWDYELFRILPAVLAAKSQDGANAEMVAWTDGLGSANQGGSHAPIGKDGLEFGPDLAWMKDTNSLGEALSERLEAVYANRPVGEQFYISLAPGVGNPVFDHELFYPKISFPDAGFQLLALYRFWNIMQYWSPNRLVADENWPEVLREFVPRAMLAKNKDEYQLAMMAFAAKVNDTHTNLWSSLKVRPPVGDCRLPVNLRFVEGKLVVTGFASDKLGPASGLKRGDVIEQIDGRSIEDLTKEWTPLYADSNEAARLRDMARAMTNGGCGPTRIAVLRSGLDSNQGSDGSVTVEAERGPIASMEAISRTDDLPGPTFRLLSKDVAYLKLSSIKAADVPKYIEQARGTKGLVIDIRNYPSEFVVFALGNLLVDHETPFARFTTADLANPGAFYWRDRTALSPAQPHYSGKIVILVDEVSLSQAEYTAMAFRSAPNAIVVGSMTAGADGNVSKVPLPGDVTSAISGIGVFYPDERPTQRVGIIPDIEVRPSIAGIRAGRDEVLETGIRQIVGKDAAVPNIDDPKDAHATPTEPATPIPPDCNKPELLSKGHPIMVSTTKDLMYGVSLERYEFAAGKPVPLHIWVDNTSDTRAGVMTCMDLDNFKVRGFDLYNANGIRVLRRDEAKSLEKCKTDPSAANVELTQWECGRNFPIYVPAHTCANGDSYDFTTDLTANYDLLPGEYTLRPRSKQPTDVCKPDEQRYYPTPGKDLTFLVDRP